MKKSLILNYLNIKKLKFNYLIYNEFLFYLK